MIAARPPFRPALALWLAGLLPLAPIAAQTDSATPSETAAIAAAFVRAQVPATDDPDAVVRELIAAGLRHPRSPAACVLLQEAQARLDQVLDPAALRASLPDASGDARLHGRLAQRLMELRWLLARPELGLLGAGQPPPSGYSHELLLAGPFGDDGDHHAGVVFAPELRFPAAASTLPGRGGPAQVRLVRSRPFSDYLEIQDRGRPRPGCYYGLQRYQADADTAGFLEIECGGDHQLFVDGTEVLRVERWRTSSRAHHYVPLQLPAGEHLVLVKTCSNDIAKLTLRFVDAECRPLTTVRNLPVTTTEVAIAAPAVRSDEPFLAAGLVLNRAAAAAEAPPAVLLAAAWQALRDGDADTMLAHIERLRAEPPAEPELALAFAVLLRQSPLPDEIRKAEARALIERHATSLLPGHHAARLQQVQLLEEQDQREAALRLLADHPAAGPSTWSRRFALLRQLRFRAEEVPLLQAWRRQLPRDPEPLLRLAELATASRDLKLATQLRGEALALRLDQMQLAVNLLRSATEIGDFATTTRCLELVEPVVDGVRSCERLQMELLVADARGDTEAARALRADLQRHPDSNAELLLDLAGGATRRGEREAVIGCLRAALERDGDLSAAREWLAELSGEPLPLAPLLEYRRSGQAAIDAFTAGDREQGAGTTVVIDQRLIAFAADGSWSSEVHELRRINDQSGVDAFSEGAGLGDVEELLTLRTRGTDGLDYLPARIDDDYALQQLKPGAFVEWRVREFGPAPGPNALVCAPHFFGSANEPCAVTELVVLLPPTMRGELRTRGLGAADREQTLADGSRVLVWTRRDVPALAEENFTPSLFELLPVAQVGEDDPPFMALRTQRAMLLQNTRPKAPLQRAAAELFAGAADDRERAARAYTFCQQQIETGPGDDALSVLLRKKGSRFLLTVALLRAGGVNVVPMACAEVRDELVDGEQSLFAGGDPLSVPGAAVLLPGGERIHLFVDTPRHWPLGAVPAQRRSTIARLLHDNGPESITLPAGDDAVQTLRVRGTATVRGNNLRLVATATLGDVPGYALADRIRELKDNVQKLAARQVAQQLFEGWRVESAAIAAAEPGAPMQLQVTLTRPGVQPSGDGFVVPMPMPPGRFVASYGDRAERTLPFRFAGDLIQDWQIVLDPGETLRVRQLPNAHGLQYGPLSFDQTCTTEGRTVTCRRFVQLRGGDLPAARFADWLRTLAAADRAEQATIELGPR